MCIFCFPPNFIHLNPLLLIFPPFMIIIINFFKINCPPDFASQICHWLINVRIRNNAMFWLSISIQQTFQEHVEYQKQVEHQILRQWSQWHVALHNQGEHLVNWWNRILKKDISYDFMRNIMTAHKKKHHILGMVVIKKKSDFPTRARRMGLYPPNSSHKALSLVMYLWYTCSFILEQNLKSTHIFEN